MTEIIYIVCAVCYAIFGIQFVLSLFGYDLDFDLDLNFDGTPDLSFSDIISFKGILHFLLGGSTYLSAVCWQGGSIIWIDCILAALCGIVFVLLLGSIYKTVLSLQKEIKREQDISGREVLIIRGGNGKYVGQAEINGALEDFDVETGLVLEVGKSYKILKFINNKIYI